MVETMTVAVRSVCYRVGSECRVIDWRSIEEAAALPIPCGRGCGGDHAVVVLQEGRWVVIGPRPATPGLEQLYPRPRCLAVDEPRYWPAPSAYNAPMRVRVLGPDPDPVGRPTAEPGGNKPCPTTNPRPQVETCRDTPPVNRVKRECLHHHPLDAENTYLRPHFKGRQCRACHRENQRRYRRRAAA